MLLNCCISLFKSARVQIWGIMIYDNSKVNSSRTEKRLLVNKTAKSFTQGTLLQLWKQKRRNENGQSLTRPLYFRGYFGIIKTIFSSLFGPSGQSDQPWLRNIRHMVCLSSEQKCIVAAIIHFQSEAIYRPQACLKQPTSYSVKSSCLNLALLFATSFAYCSLDDKHENVLHAGADPC